MRDLIGKPWAVPCNPPDTFDCWELVRHVRRLHGLLTPDVVAIGARGPRHRRVIERPPVAFRQMLNPWPFCIARLGPQHVGVWLDRDSIMHCELSTGVAINRPEYFHNDITYWEVADHE